MELRIALQFVQKLFSVACKGLTGYLAARYMKCIVPHSSPEKLQYKHIDPFFSQELKIPILNAKKNISLLFRSTFYVPKSSVRLMLMNEKYMLRCFLEHMSYLGLSKHNYEIKERYLMACPLNEQIPRGPRTFIGEKVRKREARSIFKKKKLIPQSRS